MSVDSTTAVRRATKRLRPAAESASALVSSGSKQQQSTQRVKRVSVDATPPQQGGDDDDEDAADDELHMQQQSMGVDNGEEDEAEEEELEEDEEDNSDKPPPILHSTSKLPPSTGGSSALGSSGGDTSYLRIPVPAHRYTPLKQHWQSLYQPIVEHMKLQIRFNPKKRCIELRTSELTSSASSLHKSADFLRAFLLGFDLSDAIALLRLDDLYIESFEVRDVKSLHGEHLSRAIGRIAGQSGKTRFTIENATKTRIVLADTHIHVLGSYTAIQTAKSAIVKLIMGAPPGKVYTQLRTVANRAKERF